MSETATIEATINAPVARVWQAYNTPSDITQWNFAHESWCCPSAEVDLREGGTYTARMEAKDGSFGFDFGGVYEEVVPEESIVLLMGDGRRSRTRFNEADGQTKVVIEFDLETQNSMAQQREGWQAILDNFARYVEAKA